MRQSTVIKLPVPLHANLKALAKVRNKTMVQLIADMIDEAIIAGDLTDTTHGFLVEAVGNTVEFYAKHTATCGDRLAVMTPEQANGLADTLEGIRSTPIVAHVVEDGVLTVRRKGTGISFEPDVNDPSKSYVVAPIVALSLARQIRKAAQQAANQ